MQSGRRGNSATALSLWPFTQESDAQISLSCFAIALSMLRCRQVRNPQHSRRPRQSTAGRHVCSVPRAQWQFGHSTESESGRQTWRYIYLQLRDFKEGRRTDPQMTPMAKDLSRDDMIALGNWFAAQKPAINQFKADSAKVAAGIKTADAVLCAMCHLGGFSGQNEIPRVAGQKYEYVVKQLQDFKNRRRTNDAGNMTSVAGTLSDQDIDNLAQYITTLN